MTARPSLSIRHAYDRLCLAAATSVSLSLEEEGWTAIFGDWAGPRQGVDPLTDQLTESDKGRHSPYAALLVATRYALAHHAHYGCNRLELESLATDLADVDGVLWPVVSRPGGQAA